MTTPTLVLAYAQQDEALGSRLSKDLQAQGWTVQPELTADTPAILIPFVSSASNADKAVQATLIQGLDRLLQIIPVQAGDTALPMPKLIDHLQPVNFVDGYRLNVLIERVQISASPNAPRPLKVLTPTRRRNNQSTATWLAILAVIWFIIGVVLVGFYGIQAPTEEYNSVDTEVAATIQEYVRANLPHSTEEAVNFPATVQAAPTGQQPLLMATATAMAAPK